MGCKRKVIDKEFKMNAVQYRKEHPELTYTEIADHLFQNRRKEVKSIHRQPDCKHIHQELKRKGVTLMILWKEYVEESIVLNESYIKYTQFCNVYKKYVKDNQFSMHILQVYEDYGS